MRLKSSLSLLALSVFLLFLFGIATEVRATSSESILVSVSPTNPTPLENVNINLNSYAANLDTVMISWFVNGKNSLSGIGKKSFSLTAGASGSITQILVKVLLPDGEIDKSITITPSVTTLLWQATDSYVPPFYKGKALIPAESMVKVVAMPEIKVGGSKVSAKNLTYTWKKDYTNVSGVSGYGKNSFTFINDYLDSSNNVSVVASTLDQQFSSEANVNLGTTNPEILFYKKDSTLGIGWEHSIENDHQVEGEEIFMAAPYFFSPKDVRRIEVKFNWFINGLAVSVPTYQKNILPVKVESGQSGVSKIRLQIENDEKIFESADREIRVQF